MKSVGGRREVALGQNGTRVSQRVYLDANSFVKPLLQKGFAWGDGVAKNAQWGATVDLFEAIENGAAKRLVNPVVAHVVDAQRDDGFDSFFADPLGCGQLGEREADIKRVIAVKVSQAISRGVRMHLAKRSQWKEEGEDRLAKAAQYGAVERHEPGTDHALGQAP